VHVEPGLNVVLRLRSSDIQWVGRTLNVRVNISKPSLFWLDASCEDNLRHAMNATATDAASEFHISGKFGCDQPEGVRGALNEGQPTMVLTNNLLSSLPDVSFGEVTEALLSAHGVRLQRIVSQGQVSPPDYWYDQDEAEWVFVLNGSARLAIAGEHDDRLLREGDSIFLPAHCRHRVTWTDTDVPTVWLALFIDAALAPKLADPIIHK
jgi:cupin 2 domain-containing protein